MKDRILAAREKLGLTQVEVANRAGLQHATYQRVESGERGERVSAVVVLRIARALGTTVEDLLGPDVPWPGTVKPQKLTPEADRLVRLIEKLDERMTRLEARLPQQPRGGKSKS